MIQEFIKTFFKMPRGRWTKYRPRPEQPYQWSVGYTCKGYDGKHGVVAWEVPEETADALLALKGLYDRYAEEHGAKCQGCGGSGLMPSRIIDASQEIPTDESLGDDPEKWPADVREAVQVLLNNGVTHEQYRAWLESEQEGAAR